MAHGPFFNMIYVYFNVVTTAVGFLCAIHGADRHLVASAAAVLLARSTSSFLMFGYRVWVSKYKSPNSASLFHSLPVFACPGVYRQVTINTAGLTLAAYLSTRA